MPGFFAIAGVMLVVFGLCCFIVGARRKYTTLGRILPGIGILAVAAGAVSLVVCAGLAVGLIWGAV